MFKNRKNFEKNLKFFSWLGAIVITLILPCLYLLGLVYYQAYMNGFGISSTMFPLTTADVYINAFVMISIVFFRCLSALIAHWKFIGGFVLVCGGILFAVIRVCKVENMHIVEQGKKTLRLSNTKSNKYILINLMDFIFKVLWVAIMTLVLLWVCVEGAIKVGKNSAEGDIKNYLKNGCEFDSNTKWSGCVKLTNRDGLTLQEGLFVAKNSEEVALFRKEGSYVFRLNHDSVIVKLRNE